MVVNFVVYVLFDGNACDSMRLTRHSIGSTRVHWDVICDSKVFKNCKRTENQISSKSRYHQWLSDAKLCLQYQDQDNSEPPYVRHLTPDLAWPDTWPVVYAGQIEPAPCTMLNKLTF
jgi:hypothetical protein